MRPFSISNNIYFFENKRSNLSILASQGELAGTLLISQIPSGEGVLIRETGKKVAEHARSKEEPQSMGCGAQGLAGVGGGGE